MNIYLDTSAFLRLVLAEPDALVATHDAALGQASREHGFKVLGL